jgi:hypothetical protein
MRSGTTAPSKCTAHHSPGADVPLTVRATVIGGERAAAGSPHVQVALSGHNRVVIVACLSLSETLNAEPLGQPSTIELCTYYLSLIGAIPISLCNGKSLHLGLISTSPRYVG